jgi:trk system potassium uptake protein TrkA
MNIIIVGCGKVGETLAAELGGEGNDITVVDLSSDKIKDICERFDVMGVVGNGATNTTLREAGVENADLLIAVTESDELNLLCCVIAKKTGKCRVIARLRNPEYRQETDYIKNELALAMLINPEFAAAEEISRILRFPAADKIDAFSGGRVELMTFRLTEENKLVGMAVKDVVAKLKCDILVCTVERGEEAFIANGSFVFEGGDIISIIASPKKAADFFNKIGYKGYSVKDVMVIGAGDTTNYLCDLLKKSGISIKVVDNDYEKCKQLSAEHKEAIVINGDETDRELLVEEGIESADAFVVLADNDEQNILLSLFAKNKGRGKVITKISRSEYDDVIKHLEFDTAIYPKNITSDIIVRYVRAISNTLGSNVETMYNVIKGKVEASEFIVSESSEVVGIPLSKLRLKDNVLIAAIIRGNEVITPRGQDVILPQDSVIVVSKILALNDISEVLK